MVACTNLRHAEAVWKKGVARGKCLASECDGDVWAELCTRVSGGFSTMDEPGGSLTRRSNAEELNDARRHVSWVDLSLPDLELVV